MSKEAIIEELAGREYYWSVAYGFIEEAVENVLDEAEKPLSIDEIDKRIREEYI